MKGRIKEDDSSVPSADGDYAYYARFRQGGQHPLICRERRAGGAEEVLLDGDALARGKAFFDLGASRHSPDHTMLAWSADEAGSEFFTLRVRDLGSLTDLADIIPDVSGSVVWTADAKAFYYVRLDQQHRPLRVFRHRLGTLASDDVLIYETQESGFFVSVSQLQSGRFG
jgi:oligopeptidase B